jgi:hypothetical protein
MSKTPADFGGPLHEDEILFYDQYGILPTQDGSVLFSDGYFYAKDQYGTFNLRQAGAIDDTTHEGIDTLTHSITEDSYEVCTYVGPNLTNITHWTDSSKVLKIREEQHTYNNCFRPLQTVNIQYDSLGNIMYTVVEQYFYSSCGRVSRIERNKI